jgi:hypothetical protein
MYIHIYVYTYVHMWIYLYSYMFILIYTFLHIDIGKRIHIDTHKINYCAYLDIYTWIDIHISHMFWHVYNNSLNTYKWTCTAHKSTSRKYIHTFKYMYMGILKSTPNSCIYVYLNAYLYNQYSRIYVNM